MKGLLILLLIVTKVAWSASYTVKVKGQSAGRATLSFTLSADQQYKVNLSLYPIALAKLFGINDMVETAEGQFKAGYYYPKTYQRKKTNGEVLLKVEFLPQQVRSVGEKGVHQFIIETKGQDPLSQLAQIQYDLSHQKLAKQYVLVTEKQQRNYQVKNKVTVQGHQVVLREETTGDRLINLWYDKQFKLQRMEKIKRGQRDFDMQLITD